MPRYRSESGVVVQEVVMHEVRSWVMRTVKGKDNARGRQFITAAPHANRSCLDFVQTSILDVELYISLATPL